MAEFSGDIAHQRQLRGMSTWPDRLVGLVEPLHAAEVLRIGTGGESVDWLPQWRLTIRRKSISIRGFEAVAQLVEQRTFNP